MKNSTQVPRHTAIVVDDNVAIRVLMREILRLGGYSVVAEAANGIDAVEKYLEFRPTLTIMDVNMPHRNGIEATAEIVSIDRKAKVVMCTSLDDDGIHSAAEGAGACGIITKPFSYEQVHEVIAAVMECGSKFP